MKKEEIRNDIFDVLKKHNVKTGFTLISDLKDLIKSYILQSQEENIKIELTNFLDFLLKNGYCDTDVYAEPPTAIDQYLKKKTN